MNQKIMRTSDPNPAENQPDSMPRPIGWGCRTVNDATSLLLELARAHRGFGFYDETSSQREALCDRAYRALSSEIHRAGPVEFLVETNGLRLQEFIQCVETHGVLGEFEAALRRHGLIRLHFDESLAPTALHGLFDQLVRSPERFGTDADFARTLAARDTSGISLNEDKLDSACEVRSLNETPLRAAATAGSNWTEEAQTKRTQTRVPVPSPAPSCASQDTDDTDTIPTPDSNAPHGIDADPLASPSRADRGERLRARLIELDLTHDDETYRARASEIVVWAEELSNEGFLDDCYRAEVILADHAVGHGGRAEAQARVAAASFSALAEGPRLADLVERAACSDAHPVRPAQMLLQLGDAAAPVILQRLFREDGGPRTEALEALMMTLGESALPPIVEAIRAQDDRCAQIAIRLAGRIQSPMVLPTLIDALQSSALGRRVDAIHALSFLPGEASKQALESALQSDLEEIAVAASQAVATNDGIDAVPTLLDALDVSLRSYRTQLSRSLIEVLGRLGDERAVPRLSAALERKPMLRRAHWHAAQLAAVDALAVLPTKEARRSIERAALYGAPPIQARARARLEVSE